MTSASEARACALAFSGCAAFYHYQARNFPISTAVKPLALHARRTHIYSMKNTKLENMVGALSLAIADSVHKGTQEEAPEVGPAAAAIALLGHEPGISIERLRRALALSHPGAVRLVDRLVTQGVVERRQAEADRRTVALHLTSKGTTNCAAVLAVRHERIARALKVLDPSEREILGRITEKLLHGLVHDLDQAYSVCRLCDSASCTNCPVAEAVDQGH